jgi:hypothetical protein
MGERGRSMKRPRDAANPSVPSRTLKEAEEEITSEGAGDRERLLDPYQRKQSPIGQQIIYFSFRYKTNGDAIWRITKQQPW